MTARRTGIALLCDARGRVIRWLRDDLSLRARATKGQPWRQLLDPGSFDKAEAFVSAACAQGAALDWLLYVPGEQAPLGLRFTAAFTGETLTLLACVASDAASHPRRTPEAESCADLARVNDELVKTQRTLTKKNAELEQTNAELGEIHTRLEASQRELLAANRRLVAQANRDGLTGVYNRRAFQKRLMEEVERADRYGQALSLAMIDVDYFKQYNDTLGHLAGDDALRTVASVLQSSIRSCDFLARYGGEEFAAILPNIVGDPAESTCQRLRAAVANITSFPQPVTVSVGVATYGPLTPTAEELIQRADQALYNAKQAGRNRVITAWQMPCP